MKKVFATGASKGDAKTARNQIAFLTTIIIMSFAFAYALVILFTSPAVLASGFFSGKPVVSSSPSVRETRKFANGETRKVLVRDPKGYR